MAIAPTRLKAACRYISLLRNNEAKQLFAIAYLNYRRNGGNEPERGTLSYMGAQAVRRAIDSILTTDDMDAILPAYEVGLSAFVIEGHSPDAGDAARGRRE